MTTPRGGSGVDPQVARVLAGYIGLSSEQQSQFVTLVNRYIEGDTYERTEMRGKFGNRMDVGPLRGTCPYCGR